MFAPGDKKFEFDYTVNKEAIEIYWMERLRESKDFNMIYTMGIRGVHDSPFQCRLLENPTLENRVKLLQKVINRQREMITEVFGREDAVPQIFVPYEETAELYNGETKNGEEKCQGLVLPEDIIIVSTEDNYGYLRQLPTESELARKGGCGIYYHLAYQGFPSPYDWITTMPYKLMQQELSKLSKVGSTDFWIVNVGDIKSCELGLNYFMKIANDNEKYLNMNPRDYVKDMAVSLFGMNKSHAESFADYYTRFCLSANMQKPEFMSSFWSIEFKENNVYGFKDLYSFYSAVDFGDEAERKLDELRALEAEAKRMYDDLAQENKVAFWHLAYYPVRATRMMAEKSYYFHKNIYYADQGRFASVNGYKYLSEKAADEIDKDLKYYNKVLCDGKWNGIMDPYADYNMFERVLDIASIPKDFVYQERFAEQGKGGIGSVCEGQLVGDEDVNLLFSSLENNSRFIDIFNKGLISQNWSVKGSKSWIVFSKREGVVVSEERIWVSIDWEKAKKGDNEGIITLTSKDGEVKTYPVVAHKFTQNIKRNSYVEGAGFVAIEAEKYSNMVKGNDGAVWSEVADLGYSGSCMRVEGCSKVKDGVGGAVLEYNVYFTSAGEFDAILYRIPTLNEGKDKSCEIAVGVDNDTPVVLEGVRRKSQSLVTKGVDGTTYKRNWQAGVFAQMEKMPFKIKIDKAGYHTFKVYQVDNEITFDRVVIATTQQSLVAQKRSLMGAPESYNNISKSYKPLEAKGENKDIAGVSILKSYPRPEPLFYGKFFFTKQGCPEVWGFSNVSKINIFQQDINLYGWDKDDVDKIIYRHNESTRLVPHFRRDYHLSKKPATFYVSLHQGEYEVTIFTGEITNYLTGNKGQTYKMTVNANGKELFRDEVIESDKLFTETFDVKVGSDNLLKLEFSGDWGISAIEIYRK